MLNLEDKYIRDHAFEPEILHERKDSIAVHRNNYRQRFKRLQEKRRSSKKSNSSLYLNIPNTIRENDGDDKNNNRLSVVTSENDDDTASWRTVLDELDATSELDNEVEEFYYVSLEKIIKIDDK